VFVVGEEQRQGAPIIPEARGRWRRFGYEIIATDGTWRAASRPNGIAVSRVNKVHEGRRTSWT